MIKLLKADLLRVFYDEIESVIERGEDLGLSKKAMAAELRRITKDGLDGIGRPVIKRA
jgi:hypothetical protein